MNNLYLDIETIPGQKPGLKEKIAETIKCPGNIKKPESIDAWELNSKPQAIEDVWLKTGLDGAYGEIISISWAWNDDDINGSIRKLEEPESELLTLLDNILNASLPNPVRIIGHNVLNFDIRFLFQRFLIHGIRPPHQIQTAINARPTDYEKVFDTMLYWSGAYSRNDWVGVDKLCMAFDIESPKSIMDGSQVWEYIQAGEYDKVLQYNKKDVETERLLAKKMGIDLL